MAVERRLYRRASGHISSPCANLPTPDAGGGGGGASPGVE